MDADPLHLQDRAPDRGQGTFGFVPGGLIVAHRQRRGVRLRQCAAVQLAVGRQRQCLQRHQRRRHHVVRQLCGQCLPPVRHTALAAHHIAHQTTAALFGLPNRHHRLAHARQPLQRRFDLAQLDPETAQLHLAVVATGKHDGPIRTPAPQVPASVVAPRAAQRIGHEPRSTELGLVQIPARHSRPADVQLPDHAYRHRTPLPVHDPDRRVADRATDRNRMPRQVCQNDLVGGGERRRLGRTVAVDQPPRALRPRQQSSHRVHVQRVASDQQLVQLPERDFQRVHVGVEQPHRQPHRTDPEPRQCRRQRRRIQHCRRIDYRHPGTVQQRCPQLPGRGVEGRVGAVRHHVVIAQRRKPAVDRQPQHRALLDHHPFRCPGRTGGIHHIGQIAGLACHHRRRIRIAGPRRWRQRQGCLEPCAFQRPVGQHHRRTAVGHQVGQAADRLLGIQRHISRPGLEHAQERDHQIQAAGGDQRNALLAIHPMRTQAVGQTIGARIQLGIAERVISIA
ncbi:hypothetical protein LMG19145_03983 [Xanthomonas arboricola pv. fragariae]|nr:hypothetical protein LMG19145_03983 [Xanthomonas arboricola pv. fragariae]